MAATPSTPSTPSTTRLTPAARRGYGLGSVATGSFGTVPGLLLLPYLTDRLGRRRRAGRPRRLPPQGVGRPPQPRRRRDQRPVDPPRRTPPALPPARGHRPRRLLRPPLRRTDEPGGPRHDVGRRPLPRLRHGLRVLPGPLRRDARRDDRRLRRADPPDDVARRDPRARHPRQRRSLAGHPRRPRARVGLPRRRGLRGPAHPRRGGRGLARHPRHPADRRRHRGREPARPAARRGGLPAVPDAAHGLRPPGARDRGDARRGRLRGPRPPRRWRRLDGALRLLRRPCPARHAALAAVRRGPGQAGRLRRRVGRAAGRSASPPSAPCRSGSRRPP